MAVKEQNEFVASAVWRQGVGDLYTCAKGSGAKHNGKAIAVSSASDLEKSFVGFHAPIGSLSRALIDRSMKLMQQLINICYRLRPGWDDARMLTWVGQGVLDAHITIAGTNKWHDVAPTVLLIQEAGGRVTTMNGNPVDERRFASEGFLATNGRIHDRLLSYIRREFV